MNKKFIFIIFLLKVFLFLAFRSTCTIRTQCYKPNIDYDILLSGKFLLVEGRHQRAWGHQATGVGPARTRPKTKQATQLLS